MPRNEEFLDPGAGPLARFAWDLRMLRETAGKMPYRVLAKRAGFCASTLSVAASGAKLPSLDVTLAYVQACGGDPETWRARWHALAAQHATVHSGGGAQPGLQIAPPYDADEHEAPAQLGAVTLRLPAHSSRLADRELLAAKDPVATAERGLATAVRGVATAEHDDATAVLNVATAERDSARPELAVRAARPQAPTDAGEPRGGSRWRSRHSVVPISRMATVALTLVTAILGLKVLADGTGATPANSPNPPPVSATPADTAMQQADALYMLIYEFTPMRSDANDAIWDVDGCRNLSNAQSKLRAIARKRQEQVEQLASLNVSKVPDHAQLVAALRHAWLTSAQSDTAYANIAADLQTGCTSGAITTDPNYQQADDYARAAASAKAEAAQVWNSNADALGQLRISDVEL